MTAPTWLFENPELEVQALFLSLFSSLFGYLENKVKFSFHNSKHVLFLLFFLSFFFFKFSVSSQFKQIIFFESVHSSIWQDLMIGFEVLENFDLYNYLYKIKYL